MASVALTNVRTFFGAYEISGDLREVALSVSANLLDATTFSTASGGVTYHSRIGGLKDTDLSAKGNVNLGSSQSDATLFANLGSSGVITIFPNGITALSTNAGSGYGFQGENAKYSVGSNVGTILPFSLSAKGASTLAKATVLSDFTASALSCGTTNGSAFAPTFSLGEVLYAGYHVTALSTTLGTSVQGIVQAASSSGFGATTNMISFTALTCKAGQWATPVTTTSTDRIFFRIQSIVSTGTGSGASVTGLAWMSLQT